MPESRSATSYKVTIGGKEFTQPQNDGVEAIVVEDHVDMVEALTLRLSGTEDAPKWTFKVGMAVEVKMGAGNALLFKGEVVGLEPSWGVDGLATLTLRALDHAHRLARGRKTRWFEKKADSDIAKTVGAECGLSVSADTTTPQHAYTLQRNESNLAFLKRLAARNNFQLAVDEGKLIFKKAVLSSSATKITMGTNLRSLRMGFNSGEQVTKVIVRGWDIREKKEVVGTCAASEVTAIGGGQVGATLASSAFGEHIAYVTDVPVSSQAQATEVAKAEMERLARQFARGSCTVDGSDGLRAGTLVEFAGLSQPHNGKYYIINSRHVITAQSGYITEFNFCGNTTGT